MQKFTINRNLIIWAPNILHSLLGWHIKYICHINFLLQIFFLGLAPGKELECVEVEKQNQSFSVLKHNPKVVKQKSAYGRHQI